jgi:MoaA/NifB/PqqE/SkfB family radical SAM enzyme
MMNKMQLKRYLSSALPNTKFFSNLLDPFPMSVHFAMTNRCNLSCTFCGQAKDKWHQDDELTFEHYKHLIDQVAAMKNRTVSFCGGEIYLYREIEKVLEYCHRQRITIEMILTNGTLLNASRIKALIDYGVKYVGFSIDGVRDSHDGIRGLKGAYDKTLAAIKKLNELKNARENPSPSIGINFVITNRSVGDMEAVAKIAADLNVNMLRFSHLNYISEKKLKEHKSCLQALYPDFNFCYWDGFIDNNTSLDAKILTREIKRIENTYRHIAFSHNLNERDIDKWYNSTDPVFNLCLFLGSCFFILPNGDFPLCDFVRYPVGNVKERSLRDLWFDDKAIAFRNSLNKKLLPGCERCCSVS